MFVDGAKLSMGDLHFSQGDGEITFCGAIEMGGFMDLHVDLIKGGMQTYGVSENAIFMPGRTDPQYSEWLAFSGTSVTLDGEQRYLDSHLSYQRACLHAIDYLTKFGYADIQAYMILGAAPIEGRLSGVVDIPNSCSTVYIPTEIFDFDVRPGKTGPTRSTRARASPRPASPSAPRGPRPPHRWPTRPTELDGWAPDGGPQSTERHPNGNTRHSSPDRVSIHSRSGTLTSLPVTAPVPAGRPPGGRRPARAGGYRERPRRRNRDRRLRRARRQRGHRVAAAEAGRARGRRSPSSGRSPGSPRRCARRRSRAAQPAGRARGRGGPPVHPGRAAHPAADRADGAQPDPPNWGLDRIDQRALPLDGSYRPRPPEPG